MARYPSLLSKQVKDYESRGFDWQEENKENVFPYLGERLPEMKRARNNLVELLPVVHEKARDFFGQEAEIIAIIYVGIGCGAGWVTRLRDELALLFGLENIAECGWSYCRSLEGLIAHELGHLFHEITRENADLPFENGPFWRLYKEGIAKWSEFKVLERKSWYEARGLNQSDWLIWCKRHEDWLAEEFLRTVEDEDSADKFFGSWYELRGWKQTGYFLGYRAVTLIQKGVLSNTNVLKLSNPAVKMKRALKDLARKR